MKASALLSLLLTALSSFLAMPANAKEAQASETLNCSFPAAREAQKIKPGAKGVSDGNIRIDAFTAQYKICAGCEWANSGAKWKVTPKQYRVDTGNGISIVIERPSGNALFQLSSLGDEHYQPARVESRGKCVPAKP